MLIDTSALLAILFAEPEASPMVDAILLDPAPVVGAPTLLEASAVMLARRGREGEVALDALLRTLGIEVVPFDGELAAASRQAYRRFGKGVGSPGVLNLGDCLSYGTARVLGEPLLCKGDDFHRTDLDLVEF